MALPGETGVIVPPQRFRLAIGETYIKDGRALPRKLDYWSVRRLSVQRGEKPTYLVDEQAQKLMCEAAGVREKPIVLPVTVIGNPALVDGKPTLPDSILWARMARYSGGKCCCTCKEFDADGKGIATERLFAEKQSGTGQYAKTYYVLARTQERECDPQACGYATGDHEVQKYKGTPLCKPQVVLSVGLPWYPVVGTVAKFKSTGWHSYRALRDSLLAISMQTNGWLHDLPDLWLVLDWELSGNGQLVPSVRVEYRGQVAALREAATGVQGRWLKQQDTLKQLQAGIVETVVEEEEKPEEQAAHQAEFAHEGYDVRPPIIDAECEPVASAPEEPHQPQRLDPTADPKPTHDPAISDEPFELSPPLDPPQVAAITDLAAFDAALKQIGVTTAAQLKELKGDVGLEGISRKELTVDQLQAVYSHARSQWQAEQAVAASG